MKLMTIREVWSHNFEHEMMSIDFLMHTYPVIAIDTEFPGFLHNTPRDASEEQRYSDLKFNVNSTKLIQLGLTLCDESGKFGVAWQLNFSNFDPTTDLHVRASIELLEKNGINFEKNRRQGIDVNLFGDRLKEVISSHERIHWVTFHGLYDLAYVLKVVTKKELPDSLPQFAEIAGDIFGSVYDIKFMARYCHGLLGGELGLERLSKILQVDRFGEAHQAGSDSLLTACVFLKMKKVYGLVDGMCEGFLYGIGAKIARKYPLTAILPFPHKYYPLTLCCPSYYQPVIRYPAVHYYVPV